MARETEVWCDHNGGPRHRRYKRKVANILRQYGYSVAGENDDEFAVQRPGDSPPYFIDVVASNGTRVLAIEIDGHKGHWSRRALLKDRNRAADIKALVKDAEMYRFAFFQLTNMPDEVIAEELGLSTA